MGFQGDGNNNSDVDKDHSNSGSYHFMSVRLIVRHFAFLVRFNPKNHPEKWASFPPFYRWENRSLDGLTSCCTQDPMGTE